MFSEKSIHEFFDISLWIKGLFALIEIVIGAGAYFVPQDLPLSVVLWVFKDEFAENQHDLVASTLYEAAREFSVGNHAFATFYLVSHGIVKLWLIIGLLREKLWYYPVAIGVFSLFIVYQLYRYVFTHSILLMALTVLDVIVIGLTVHEWKYLERRVAAESAKQEIPQA